MCLNSAGRWAWLLHCDTVPEMSILNCLSLHSTDCQVKTYSGSKRGWSACIHDAYQVMSG
jgi:hypothetical protein